MNDSHDVLFAQFKTELETSTFQPSPPSNADSSPTSYVLPCEDGVMNQVKDELFPCFKNEVDRTYLQASPCTARNSPTSSIPPNEIDYCYNSGVGEIYSPESPDGQLCSSTTSAPMDSLLCNEESLRDEADLPRRLCLVCGDIASGFHYGVASCEACKAFFKRTIQGNIDYTCPAANDCEINKRCRKACQACRFQKCLKKGMLKEGVRLDRVRGGRQKYRRSTDVPYTANSLSPEIKAISSLEDNQMLQILAANEPELLCDFIVESPVSSISVLNILAEIYDKELVSIISWAKQIPGFTDLSLTNQMRLLQSTWTELLTLTLAYRSIPHDRQLFFAKEFFLVEKAARECGALEIYQLCTLLKERLHRLNIRKEEYLLLKALVLANSDVRLDEISALKRFRDSIVSSLIECVVTIRGNSFEVSSLILCLPLLRQSDSVVRKFWTAIHQAGSVIMNKLFVEMLDPSLH